MAFINPFIKVNAGGIPRLQGTAQSPQTTTGNIVYDFEPHRFLNYPYAGMLIFKLNAQPSTPAAAGTVTFSTNGQNATQVFKYDGTALTSTDSGLTNGGVYLGWYSDDKLLLLTGV